MCFFVVFLNQLFRKILSGIPSECQTDWIQIRPDILSGLIWVHSVCNGYDQTTVVDKELKGCWWMHLKDYLEFLGPISGLRNIKKKLLKEIRNKGASS